MTVQGILGNNAPTKHSVRVDWFGRDPGGGTIFVMPVDGDGAAAQPAAEHGDDAATHHG